jgi:peptidoglycan/xylan/chitin deacetylase (PgdA/CDA1 family)
LDRVAGERLGRLARWSGLLAFNYHRIGDPTGSPYDRALWSATADGFAAQLSFLARHFDVVGLEDLSGWTAAPKGRHVLITFDDGYRDNYELAFPILRAHGLRAAFFITVGFLDDGGHAWWDEIAWMVRRSARARLAAGAWTSTELSLAEADRDDTTRRMLDVYKALPGERGGDFLEWLADATGSGRCPPSEARSHWMTWDMVREMRAAGMAIGGHSVQHPILSRLGREEQEREILGAGERIRAEVGEPMRWFAYPVGGRHAFNADTRRLLAQAGVELAFTYYGGYTRTGDWDRFDVRRIAVEAHTDAPRFRATVAFPSLYASPRGAGWGDRLRATVQELVGR